MSTPVSQMIINYVPREECRIAVVEDGNLEELYVERAASASRVGNIYVGKVTNVEAAIQAAFVDFGVGENGFLHISDLHPRYFPGETDDTTERVGLKTPRRERPPIQHALRRGDEIIVQVLKEGIGTKGPTLTSYLSIPGRFLVMMPHMDKVGVSRKVEDEELRAQMRQILDQLELPDGFGFILRTAGMDRNKTELKRDLAYLQRLWKDMERRLKSGNKPRLLYSESDLLVRALRDHLTTEIQEVVIDHEQALQRASRFLKIVAPRTQTKLLHYRGRAPVFHAFDIERQISMIHAREVPLPSGGRLVIDETEAAVCIDVNSGKSRDARDAEANAYRTNLEAIEEIARQLRLRDLGGIIINDLIDMRSAAHRRDVEGRFKERLKRDRAKTTVAPISPFGILEMTRQRMRGSHESMHFAECPTCRGRGVIMKPDSIAADALRDLQALLEYEQVGKVELVVAPRIAGELLSTKRALLNRTERVSGKHVDVRVSDAVPLDRPSFYAYDPAGADLDLSKLRPPRREGELVEWDLPAARDQGEDGWAVDSSQEPQPDLAEPDPEPIEPDDDQPHPIEVEPDDAGEPVGWAKDNTDAGALSGEGLRRRRRRGRGRGRGREGDAPNQQGQPQQPSQRHPDQPAHQQAGQPSDQPADQHPDQHSDRADQAGAELQPGGPAQAGEPGQRRRKRRRRGRGRGRGLNAQGQPMNQSGGQQPGEPGPDAGPLDPSVPADQQPQHSAPEGQDADPTEPAAPHEGDDEGFTGEAEGFTGLPPDQQGEGGPSEGGRRRRRRRRRGGRGRGGQGGDQGQQQGPAQGPPQGQPQGQRPPQAPNDRPRNNRPRNDQPRGDQRPLPPAPRAGGPAPSTPAPKPPQQPAPGGALPPPRGLYAAARRRLNPSELNKRPKPE